MSDAGGVARAKPLLGTRVAIRVHGLGLDAAHRAIEAAFAEIAAVHALMSFHDPESELSRLNRCAAGAPQSIRLDTRRVLAWALRFAAQSGGRFDPTVAPRLVASGALPAPDAPAADPEASWRDVTLRADGRVVFARPLWLDLGGIAKGFAADRAMARLRMAGAAAACVDAGGDLRVYGHAPQDVLLRTLPGSAGGVMRLRRGAVTVSYVEPGKHFDPLSGREIPPGQGVAVAAPRAVVADALTKVALADRSAGRSLALRYGAFVYGTSGAAWQPLAEPAR